MLIYRWYRKRNAATYVYHNRFYPKRSRNTWGETHWYTHTRSHRSPSPVIEGREHRRPPQAIQLRWVFWGGRGFQWKYYCNWQSWRLCSSWSCSGTLVRSYHETTMVFNGSPLIRVQWLHPLLQVVAVSRTSFPLRKAKLSPAQPIGSDAATCLFLCSETEDIWSLSLHHLWNLISFGITSNRCGLTPANN